VEHSEGRDPSSAGKSGELPASPERRHGQRAEDAHHGRMRSMSMNAADASSMMEITSEMSPNDVAVAMEIRRNTLSENAAIAMEMRRANSFSGEKMLRW